MEKIVKSLRLPLGFFLRPVSPPVARTVFYRSLSAATKADRARGERRFEWLQEIVSYVRESVELPEVNFPRLDLPANPFSFTTDQVELLAASARRFWNLGTGPISNVVWLLENNGAVVVRDELGSEALDAFSGWSDGTPYAFLGSDKASAVRSRLDASHELGHLVLHRNVDKIRLHRGSDHRLLEDQAFRFAGEFLLPASSFANDFYVPNLDALRLLKPKWGVSIGMMIKRAEDLRLVSREEARRLWISYGRRGWRRREPLDDELPGEQPRLLRRSFELIVNEAGQTRQEVLLRLPFNAADIEQLTNLPRGVLSEPTPPVRLLPSRRKESDVRDQTDPTQIITFPTRPNRE